MASLAAPVRHEIISFVFDVERFIVNLSSSPLQEGTQQQGGPSNSALVQRLFRALQGGVGVPGA